jgi:hypothetical protein
MGNFLKISKKAITFHIRNVLAELKMLCVARVIIPFSSGALHESQAVLRHYSGGAGFRSAFYAGRSTTNFAG